MNAKELDALERLFNDNADSATWKWDGKEVDDEDGRIYVPQASYFGNTNICLADTHEFSGQECELVEQAVKNLPTLISAAREVSRLRDQLLLATGMLEHQKYCRECAESWDSCEEGRKADQFLTDFHKSLSST